MVEKNMIRLENPMNQPKKERFKTSVGGQALMEGIMMRGPKLI